MSSIVLNHLRRISPRVWAASAVVGGAALLSGCVVAPLDDGYSDYGYTSTTVYTTYGHPPPPRVEYRYAAPSASHIWVGGDWFWGGSRYDWRPGYWAPPGYRPAPPMPSRPVVRPNDPPRPPHWRPDGGQRPPQVQAPVPSQPPSARPERPRPPQMRPDSGERPRPEMRPERPKQEVRRERSSDGGEPRRNFQRRDREQRDD